MTPHNPETSVFYAGLDGLHTLSDGQLRSLEVRVHVEQRRREYVAMQDREPKCTCTQDEWLRRKNHVTKCPCWEIPF